MRKRSIDTSKPKKRKRVNYEPQGLASLREAIDRAHKRIVGAEPFTNRSFQYGKRQQQTKDNGTNTNDQR